MSLNFDYLSNHQVPLNEFRYHWRFNDADYDLLPEVHLKQLMPLDNEASNSLWKYINQLRLHDDVPFKKGLFNIIDKARIFEGNEKEIKKWLYQRGLQFDKKVYLSWTPTEAMVVPWKLLIKYFNAFYYGGSDDLTVIDDSLIWALLFYHEDEIYFGTNEKYVLSKTFENIEFIW